jgi:hypothetical protein
VTGTVVTALAITSFAEDGWLVWPPVLLAL